MERPEEASDTLIPGLGSFLQYDIAGGHQLIVAGGISDVNSDPLNQENDNDHEIGWVVGAGANINLADIATFTVGAQYTEGLATRWMNQLDSSRAVCENAVVVEDPDTGVARVAGCADFDENLQRAWGITGGLTFNVNDTTSINLEAGYAKNIDADQNELLTVDNVVTAHGNILWQPVKQLRLGWEAMWGRNELIDNPVKFFDEEDELDRACRNVEADEDQEKNHCPGSNEDFRLQFGAWFFF
jgi:hypothetical protein